MKAFLLIVSGIKKPQIQLLVTCSSATQLYNNMMDFAKLYLLFDEIQSCKMYYCNIVYNDKFDEKLPV